MWQTYFESETKYRHCSTIPIVKKYSVICRECDFYISQKSLQCRIYTRGKGETLGLGNYRNFLKQSNNISLT